MLNNHEDAVEIIGQIESRNAISEDKNDRLLLDVTLLNIQCEESKLYTISIELTENEEFKLYANAYFNVNEDIIRE